MFKNALQKKYREVIHITPISGFDVRGILVHADRTPEGYVTLTHASAFLPDGNVDGLPGETLIPHRNIAMFQHLPGQLNVDE